MHFLCKVILFFAVLHVIFLQYEEKIFQLQTLKVLKQHFLTSDMYSKLLYKTLKEDFPEKKKKKTTPKPHQNWCSRRILFNNVILLSSLFSFHFFQHFFIFFLLYFIKMNNSWFLPSYLDFTSTQISPKACKQKSAFEFLMIPPIVSLLLQPVNHCWKVLITPRNPSLTDKSTSHQKNNTNWSWMEGKSH